MKRLPLAIIACLFLLGAAPAQKAIKSSDGARVLKSGPLNLRPGEKLYLKFKLNKKSERALTLLGEGESVSINRVGSSWKKGKPGKIRWRKSEANKASFEERLRVEVGSFKTVVFEIKSSRTLYLKKLPFLIERPSREVVAVGDIACSPENSQWNGGLGTADGCRAPDVRAEIKDEDVLLLGDIQYPSGTLEQFQSGFDLLFNNLNLYPVPGNHEYYTPGASGYFNYFSSVGVLAAVPRALTLGDWRVFALDSNCSIISCLNQAAWLEEEMQSAKEKCSLAFWHHPPLSSGEHGNNEDTWPLWRVFAAKGGDVVLAGHDHNYERFLPLDENFNSGSTHLFIVGTGGKSLRPVANRLPQSAFVDDKSFSALKLSLYPESFSWQFKEDAGLANCA